MNIIFLFFVNMQSNLTFSINETHENNTPKTIFNCYFIGYFFYPNDEFYK